jgi:hypothetical protein
VVEPFAEAREVADRDARADLIAELDAADPGVDVEALECIEECFDTGPHAVDGP